MPEGIPQTPESGTAKSANSNATARPRISLDDKFDLSRKHVLLNGAQAIVRLALTLRARDEAAGHNTAGYVTGYRGSPITSLESQFERAGQTVTDNQIVFHPGLNEDLAATAIWGSQQAELRGEGKYDGVFGIWYGKGPGVDRSGDVFRHANHAGTSRLGGVLALMGDDHTCESSTSAHQSEFAFVDAMIPVLNPAGVQEILDYGVIGIAMSRYTGAWVGIKCVKDNVEATATVDGRADRIKIASPTDYDLPEGGLNIRLGDAPLDKEARLHDHKRDAILAFARANKLDKIITSGGPAPKIGIISTGKSYLDTRQALDELGIDEVRANALGIRIMKVAMPWPLEPEGLKAFAKGLDLIVVVEEKRSLIEVQVKEELYGQKNVPAVIGKRDEHDQWLFPAKGALEPVEIGLAIGERIMKTGGDAELAARLDVLKRHRGNKPEGAEIASRIPYFCAGCPHNSSTVVPDGAHAFAGIGCHYMALWMDRATEGFTQMGGEGANWIGEAPFSTRDHVFQNLGDGTYTHSGSLAVRAAVNAGTKIIYKILYNDAVAMTGGQSLDGGLSVGHIARQMSAEGVSKIVVVTDEPDKYPRDVGFPHGTTVEHRSELGQVQEGLAATDGVSIMIYDQTCAAEKRRRRKRGLYPDPAKRAFINPAVCEGCGDCGTKSNCVAVVPVETAFGRKRAIDQSTCNKDFSCVEGFCPSFVTVHGGHVRKPAARDISTEIAPRLAELPQPTLPTIDGSWSIVIAGVGGTGVVTISAILGQAAHIDGLGFGAIDMAGLAQKGGAVACHVRIAETPDDIHSIRAGLGGADTILGCDLVVTGSHKVLETIRQDHTKVALNSHEMITGDFTRNPELELPAMRLKQAVNETSGDGNTYNIDAHRYAMALFGDSIASNMFMLGLAWQRGMIPLTDKAIQQAIELNGAAIAMNQRAFACGRIAAEDSAFLDTLIGVEKTAAANGIPETLDEIVAHRQAHLSKYQDDAYAEKYAKRIRAIASREDAIVPGSTALASAAATAYAKVLAYKDEYEVARLYTAPAFTQALQEQFDGDYTLQFHLAPPILSDRDPKTGELKKRAFGPWMMRAFRILAKLKGLRGTRWDVFGYTEERKTERQAIADYEELLELIVDELTPANHATAMELADLANSVRGFGHVKEKAAETATRRASVLIAVLKAPDTAPTENTRSAA